MNNISLQDKSKMLWQFISPENRSNWFGTDSENINKDFDELEPYEKWKLENYIIFNKKSFNNLTRQEDWIMFFQD